MSVSTGYRVVVVDNLSNSRPDVLDAIERIAGARPAFFPLDVRDECTLSGLFARHDIAAVIHFAGLKSVSESLSRPKDYYSVNVHGSLALASAMEAAGIFRLVFSSSATVYGEPQVVPIPEHHPTVPVSPYGRTKLAVECMLREMRQADDRWSIACLRYFNPAGAHPSGWLSEQPTGEPNNLLPYLSQVLCGKRPVLRIFGNDYPTRDGTPIRGYLHPMDLADAHVLALDALFDSRGYTVANLGTGQGHSVLDVLAAYEAESGRRIPVAFAERRPGDASTCYADPSFAHSWLGWRAVRTLNQMCADAWRFQQRAATPQPVPPVSTVATKAMPARAGMQ